MPRLDRRRFEWRIRSDVEVDDRDTAVILLVLSAVLQLVFRSLRNLDPEGRAFAFAKPRLLFDFLNDVHGSSGLMILLSRLEYKINRLRAKL